MYGQALVVKVTEARVKVCWHSAVMPVCECVEGCVSVWRGVCVCGGVYVCGGRDAYQ